MFRGPEPSPRQCGCASGTARYPQASYRRRKAVKCPGILRISLVGLVQLVESPQAVAFPSRDSAQVLESQRILVNALDYYILSLSGKSAEYLKKRRNKVRRIRWSWGSV